jgi:chemotaxis protein methyltransferase CheR
MSRQAPSTDALVADVCYRTLKDYLIESTGLAYYLDKDVELAEKIANRLEALNMSGCSAYLALLKDGQDGEAELDELVTDLTIGETYFFRHEEQFEALRQTILPDIIRRNASRRQIRIWSAGCATGAETYSISILLHREFAAELAGWDVSIVGTDINRKFLAQAREGQFGDWTLRGTGEEIKSACFLRSARSWRIRDEYREGIALQYHNLVKHPYPSLLHNLAAFDLILCRNVMIYFSHEVIRDCVNRFWSSLVDGGWLLVGHAEFNPEFFRAFQAINAPGTVLFTRAGEPPKQPAYQTDGWVVESATPATAPWQPSSLPDLPLLLRRPPIAPAAADTKGALGDSLTVQIRELADRAQWEAAGALCQTLIGKDNLNPLGHFYHALVLEQMGRRQEAEHALSRAIYLDRDFALAHYHKGLLLQNGEDLAGAVRSFRNVLTLLRPMAPDRRFAEADGISAADLAELAQMQLEVLEET